MQILGIPETVAAFGRLQAEAEIGEDVAERAGAEVLAAEIRSRTPVRTGQLRSSIQVMKTEEGTAVAATVPYARFVEFGTRFMDPQPFMGESADNIGSKVGSAIAAVFKRILR